jgi:hypothetical protein
MRTLFIRHLFDDDNLFSILLNRRAIFIILSNRLRCSRFVSIFLTHIFNIFIPLFTLDIIFFDLCLFYYFFIGGILFGYIFFNVIFIGILWLDLFHLGLFFNFRDLLRFRLRILTSRALFFIYAILQGTYTTSPSKS